MTSIIAIKKVIEDVRRRRGQWILSRRPKNIRTLATLAITDTLAFDAIYSRLVWQDYVSGPEPDNRNRPQPGAVWVFGLTINGRACYLKFQDRPVGIVMWISLHIGVSAEVSV